MDTAFARIVTCDPATRKIEGTLKDGSVIQIIVWELPGVFVWPKLAETWGVTRTRGVWRLGNRIEDAEGHSIQDLQPGEAKIDADEVFDGQGRRFLTEAVGLFVGQMVSSAVSAPNDRWLPCNGDGVTDKHPLLRAKLIADGNPHGSDDSGNPRVPDTQGRAVAGAGTGPGLTERLPGDKWGVEAVGLTAAQSGLREHDHGGFSELMTVNKTHNHATAGNGQTIGSGTGYPNAVNLTVGGGAFGSTTAPLNDATIDHRHPIPLQTEADATETHDNTPPSVAVRWFVFAG
ncbi:tail fiber protein [Candidatus Solirubrobacter pratensis]|uniref:tail fiber protein n=1 Tax=Candidatus Solirubrobacter pratensis TaxID=1298857 RepID=UPI00048562F1|nr:tail fiber protein [Candidatus Solirubrobacter pratensis]